MTIRRDKFATRTNPKPRLLRTYDIFDWKGQRYIVRSHSRWYCWAVRFVPPDPNLGRIVADEFAKLCDSHLKTFREMNEEYATQFASHE